MKSVVKVVAPKLKNTELKDATTLCRAGGDTL